MNEKREFILNCIDDFKTRIDDLQGDYNRARYSYERVELRTRINECLRWLDTFKLCLEECEEIESD